MHERERERGRSAQLGVLAVDADIPHNFFGPQGSTRKRIRTHVLANTSAATKLSFEVAVLKQTVQMLTQVNHQSVLFLSETEGKYNYFRQVRMAVST